jgi:hypothetical protein
MNMEKVLTISAKEYVETVGKSLGDYIAVGVHAINTYTAGTKNSFINKIPVNAEVVVNYTIRDAYGSCESGTALIPKNNGRITDRHGNENPKRKTFTMTVIELE